MTKEELENKLKDYCISSYKFIGTYNGFNVYDTESTITGIGGFPLVILEKNGDYKGIRSFESLRILTKYIPA